MSLFQGCDNGAVPAQPLLLQSHSAHQSFRVQHRNPQGAVDPDPCGRVSSGADAPFSLPVQPGIGNVNLWRTQHPLLQSEGAVPVKADITWRCKRDLMFQIATECSCY